MVACAGLLAITACKKSTVAEGPVNVGGFLTSGTWHVARFESAGVDTSAAFSSYALTFAPSGTVTAGDSTASASGSWGAGLADGVSKVSILFNAGTNVSALNADWNVLNASETGVELADTSYGGRLLLLERN